MGIRRSFDARARNDGNIAMTIAMTIHRRSVLTLLAAAPLLALPRNAAAQNYPTRPIHLIVPYPPGGPTDVVARILANSLGAKLGQTIVVDNRPGGAAGTVGAHVVVSADPDGYTLLLNQAGSLTISPSLYKLDYDPLKAFAPIGIVASSPEILVVNPSVPAKSVPEFIAYAKKNPGKINFGTPGAGTLPHLLGAQLQLAAGIKIISVPYRGAGPAVIDLLGGQMQMMIDSTSVLLAHIQSGKVRALAVTSEKRIPQLPNLPTFAESGYPQLTENLWTGLLAPAGTPTPIIQRISSALDEALKTPEVEKAYQKLDVNAQMITPAALASYMAKETHKWADVISKAGIKADN
jgi:tripartite-type tricarboxylate transporter receptor subunit TctC